MGPGRGGFWVLEGVDFEDGVHQLVAEQPRLGGKKGIVGSGRGLWVLEGVGFGDGVRQLVAEQPRLGGKKGIVGSGRGLWVLEGDCG